MPFEAASDCLFSAFALIVGRTGELFDLMISPETRTFSSFMMSVREMGFADGEVYSGMKHLRTAIQGWKGVVLRR
jgi:hypothetical protein